MRQGEGESSKKYPFLRAIRLMQYGLCDQDALCKKFFHPAWFILIFNHLRALRNAVKCPALIKRNSDISRKERKMTSCINE